MNRVRLASAGRMLASITTGETAIFIIVHARFAIAPIALAVAPLVADAMAREEPE